ncbi:MAG: hypothetical protein ACRDQZ_15350 [Mycobacteriales bacterium]
MLLDGFIVLGRILDGGATPPRTDALESLKEMLNDTEHWAAPPAKARELAEHILRFWDEYVAVFVVNAAEQLTTRSKVFAEIATAMWARECELEQLMEWLSEALLYTDSDGAIALAAGLDPRTIAALLDVGDTGRPEAALMVADLATRGITTLEPRELERTLGQLATGAIASRDGAQPSKRGPRVPPAWLSRDETHDPGQWPFVEAACLLALPDALRAGRANLISEASLDERSGTIAAALCELTDATTDSRSLSVTGVASVNEALAIPLPLGTGIVQTGRRRITVLDTERVAPGLIQVVSAAVERLNELAEDAREQAFQIARHAPLGIADNLFAALKRAGVDTSRLWRSLTGTMRDFLAAHKENEADLLADASSLAGPDSAKVNNGFWSFTDLGDLLAATGYHQVTTGDFNQAFDHDSAKLRRSWLEAVAEAYGLNKSAIASQARYIQQLSKEVNGSDALNDDWFVVATKAPTNPALLSKVGTVLTAEQLHTLLSCLEAESDWMAWAAACILSNVKNPPWNSQELFKTDMSDWPLSRATLLYMVAIFTAGSKRKELLAAAASSASTDYRCAARNAISGAPKLDPGGLIMETLRRDPDRSVRPKSAWKELPVPTCWTCYDCRTANDVDDEDCAGCEDGVRPDA